MNLAGPEVLVGLVSIGLLVLWIMGVAKLFRKGHRTLGWVAIVGLLVPIIALVGYAGWFIQPKAD